MAFVHALVAPASTLGCRLRRCRSSICRLELLPLLLLLLLLDALLAPRLSLLKLQCGLVAGLDSVNNQQPAISRA